MRIDYCVLRGGGYRDIVFFSPKETLYEVFPFERLVRNISEGMLP